MNSTKKKILILANYLPDGGWGGGVIVRSLIQHPPSSVSLNWTTFDSSLNQSSSPYSNIKILPFTPNYIKGQGKFKLIRKIDSIQFAHNLNALIHTHHIDLLWIVLGVTYNELYRLSILSERLKIPYHVTVHDDPIVELEASQKKEGSGLFQTLLSNAQSIDVVSERMQRTYKQDYNVESIVITRGIPATFPNNHLRKKESIQILMGGYGNVSTPWPLPLIESIERMQNTRPCFLHLFDPKLKNIESFHVKVYDSLPEVEFNEILSTIDIGYACDDLREERLPFAQLSLPTKIITYIGAGIPFVYHGPKDSTVGDLLSEYEAGIIVSTNNSEDLYNAFTMLLANYDYYQQNCFRALQNRFASSIVQNSFYTCLLNP